MYSQNRKTIQPVPERPLYRDMFFQVGQSFLFRLKNKTAIVKSSTLRLNRIAPDDTILF